MSGCENLKLYPQTLQRDISTTYSDKSNQLECLRSVSLTFLSQHESESFRENPLAHWLCHAVSWLELSYWVRSRINLCRFFDNLIRRGISAVSLIILICINIKENSRCENFLYIDFNFYFKLLEKKNKQKQLNYSPTVNFQQWTRRIKSRITYWNKRASTRKTWKPISHSRLSTQLLFLKYKIDWHTDLTR